MFSCKFAASLRTSLVGCLYILSNDSRVCKSNEELMSAFNVFTLHTGHCDSSSFFQLKYMLPDNLNKICVHILTLLLAFPISVLLTSGGISSDSIWEERKLKKTWIQVESLTSFFGLPF